MSQAIRVSKFLSYLLRHNPYNFKLEIDKEGFANIEDIIHVLREKFTFVDREYFENLVKNSQKKRFEIRDGKIRALYGHSINIEIRYPEIKPPQVLYHGTSEKALRSILKQGLKPMGRKKVHLSRTIKEAYEVGKRKSSNPIIIEVNAVRAYNHGIKFYDAGAVILSDFIPPQYLRQI